MRRKSTPVLLACLVLCSIPALAADPIEGWARMGTNSMIEWVAGSQGGKVNGLPTPQTPYVNTCYSMVGDEYGFSVAHQYRVENGTFKYIKEGSGISPMAMPDKSPVPAIYRKLEAEYADGWLRNVMADAFV